MPQERLISWQEHTLTVYAEDLTSSSLTGEQIAQHVAESARELFPDGGLREGHSVLEVVIEGEAGGYLWVGPSDSTDDFYVFDVEIDGQFRGRGFGRAAMRAAEEIARERGYHGVALTVADANMVARGLYESEGYETVGARQGRRFMRRAL
jgi:ribosomal protein S18 acetylase RimI-like enzyme